jgi:hypothetical protein
MRGPDRERLDARKYAMSCQAQKLFDAGASLAFIEEVGVVQWRLNTRAKRTDP